MDNGFPCTSGHFRSDFGQCWMDKTLLVIDQWPPCIWSNAQIDQTRLTKPKATGDDLWLTA